MEENNKESVVNENTILVIGEHGTQLRCDAIKDFSFSDVKIAAICNLIVDHMALNVPDEETRKTFEYNVLAILNKMIDERYETEE